MRPFTVIASDPDRTCMAECSSVQTRSRQVPSKDGLGRLHVIADDPNTTCEPEGLTVEGDEVQALTPRYRPAYELTDGRLERAGRFPGAALVS